MDTGFTAPRREETVEAEILSRLEELGVADDSEFVAEAIQTFVDDTNLTLEQLRSAIPHGDAAAVEKLAHRLKGASLNLGAESLGGIARTLEKMGRDGSIEGAGVLLEQLQTEFELVRRFSVKLRRRSAA